MNAPVKDKVVITALVENTVNLGGLRAEHGLSFLIRVGARKLLFDTGQTDLLAYNARQLGLSLTDVDTVILSHGHYDHTGGLAAVHKLAPGAKVFLHPAAAEPKFVRDSDGRARAIGMKPESLAVIAGKRSQKDAIVWTIEPVEVAEGMWVTGEIPRRTDFVTRAALSTCGRAKANLDISSNAEHLFLETL